MHRYPVCRSFTRRAAAPGCRAVHTWLLFGRELKGDGDNGLSRSDRQRWRKRGGLRTSQNGDASSLYRFDANCVQGIWNLRGQFDRDNRGGARGLAPRPAALAKSQERNVLATGRQGYIWRVHGIRIPTCAPVCQDGLCVGRCEAELTAVCRGPVKR